LNLAATFTAGRPEGQRPAAPLGGHGGLADKTWRRLSLGKTALAGYIDG
jgi:hypothetical protein